MFLLASSVLEWRAESIELLVVFVRRSNFLLSHSTLRPRRETDFIFSMQFCKMEPCALTPFYYTALQFAHES